MSDTLAVAVVELGVSGLDKVKAALGSVKSGLGSMGIGLGTLGIAAGVGATLALAVKRAMEAEKATQAMKSALAATGQEVEKNIAGYKKLAEQIQRVTGQSKGETLALIETGLKMNLTAKQAEEYALKATGFAKRTGMPVEEAMTQLVKLGNGMRNTLDRSVPAIAACKNQAEKMAMAAKLAGEGIKMSGEDANTVSARFDRLTATIGGLYTGFGTMLLPIVGAVTDAIQGFIEWIQQLVGAIGMYSAKADPVWAATGAMFKWLGDTITSVFSKIISTLKTWEENLVMAFMRPRLAVKLLALEVATTCVDIVDWVIRMAKKIPETLAYIRDNWRAIFTGIKDYVKGVFETIATNIRKAWDAIWNYIKGKGWHFAWDEAKKGMEDAVAKVPNLSERLHAELDATKKEWQQGMSEFKDDMASLKKQSHEDAEKDLQAKIKGSDNKPLGNVKGDKGKSSGFTDLISTWKNLQQGAIKSPAEKHAEYTARNTAAILKSSQALLAEVKKGGGGVKLK